MKKAPDRVSTFSTALITAMVMIAARQARMAAARGEASLRTRALLKEKTPGNAVPLWPQAAEFSSGFASSRPRPDCFGGGPDRARKTQRKKRREGSVGSALAV